MLIVHKLSDEEAPLVEVDESTTHNSLALRNTEVYDEESLINFTSLFFGILLLLHYYDQYYYLKCTFALHFSLGVFGVLGFWGFGGSGGGGEG